MAGKGVRSQYKVDFIIYTQLFPSILFPACSNEIVLPEELGLGVN